MPNVEGTASKTSRNVAECGTQNSSASVWITQSASMLRLRQPRHTRPPRALAHLVPLEDPAEVAVSRIRLEDVGRAVTRVVVGRDDEVDAGVQVVGDLGVDDVDLVADEERLDELHAARSVWPSAGPGSHEAGR